MNAAIKSTTKLIYKSKDRKTCTYYNFFGNWIPTTINISFSLKGGPFFFFFFFSLTQEALLLILYSTPVSLELRGKIEFWVTCTIHNSKVQFGRPTFCLKTWLRVLSQPNLVTILCMYTFVFTLLSNSLPRTDSYEIPCLSKSSASSLVNWFESAICHEPNLVD